MSWVSIFRGAGAVTKVGAVGLGRWMIKHYYIFILALVLIPAIIGSVKVGIETNNILHPIGEFGLYLVNSDALLYEISQTLMHNPEQLLGVNPIEGIWANFKYSWGIFRLALKILGLIFAISIPFVAAFRYYKVKGQKGTESSPGQNLAASIKIGLVFIFIMNLIVLAIKLATGDLQIDLAGLSATMQVSKIFMLTIPFHGLGYLLFYIISMLNA